MMQSHKNKIVIASAGCRKTSSIVSDALSQTNKRILITTYTVENTEQIRAYIYKEFGHIPSNIDVITWYSFLLKDGVKPYQNLLFDGLRIKSIDFISKPNKFNAKSSKAYYINSNNDIFKDKVSDFVCNVNEKTSGKVVKRLEGMYEQIYIDEVQDMCGWDLNFIESLLGSNTALTLVGDPRQSTFYTNNSSKNKGKKGNSIIDWIEELQKKGKCEVEERSECYRCNQIICDYADKLFPNMKSSISKNTISTGHDGIFFIKRDEIDAYIETYKPVMILRWSKTADTNGLSALNFGASKGKTFDRVLIFPTSKMKKYFITDKLSDAGDLSKLYVAITRAKFSVTFVID